MTKLTKLFHSPRSFLNDSALAQRMRRATRLTAHSFRIISTHQTKENKGDIRNTITQYTPVKVKYKNVTDHNAPRAFIDNTILTNTQKQHISKIFKSVNITLEYGGFCFDVAAPLSSHLTPFLIECGLEVGIGLINTEALADNISTNDAIFAFICNTDNEKLNELIDLLECAYHEIKGFHGLAYAKFPQKLKIYDRRHLNQALKAGVYTPEIIHHATDVLRNSDFSNIAQDRFLLQKIWRICGTKGISSLAFEAADKKSAKFPHSMLMFLAAYFAMQENMKKAWTSQIAQKIWKLRVGDGIAMSDL